MRSVFVVLRDSAEGPESDVFTDSEMANEWAKHICSSVREEFVIDRTTLDKMKKSYGEDEEGGNDAEN